MKPFIGQCSIFCLWKLCVYKLTFHWPNFFNPPNFVKASEVFRLLFTNEKLTQALASTREHSQIQFEVHLVSRPPLRSLLGYCRDWARNLDKMASQGRDLRRFVEFGRKIIGVGRNYRFVLSNRIKEQVTHLFEV